MHGKRKNHVNAHAAGFDLEVREIPGHSVGHVVFIWKDNAPNLVFVGDVIFQGSVGVRFGL